MRPLVWFVCLKRSVFLACLGLGGTFTSVALTTEECEFAYDDSMELAQCGKIHRESCACCSVEGTVCRMDMPLIYVENCGYDKSKSPNTTEFAAKRLELV